MLTTHGDRLMEQSEYDAAELQYVLANQLAPYDSAARSGMVRVRSARENVEHLRKGTEALARDDLHAAALELRRAQGPMHQKERLEVRALMDDLDAACERHIEAMAKTFLDDEAAAREQLETIQWACPNRLGDLRQYRELLDEVPAVRDVRAAFREGDASRALRLAHGCARFEDLCAKLERDVTRFVGQLKRQDALATSDDVQDLADDAADIAGFSDSSYESQVLSHGAARFSKKMQTCRVKGDWACARLYADFALELDPGNAAAKTTSLDAQNAAKELYLRAYAELGSDPKLAGRLFRRVVELTPADDEYHLKALTRVNEGVRRDDWIEVVRGAPSKTPEPDDDAQ
jgi:hypothetical protein